MFIVPILEPIGGNTFSVTSRLDYGMADGEIGDVLPVGQIFFPPPSRPRRSMSTLQWILWFSPWSKTDRP